jgi:hypothetical protein
MAESVAVAQRHGVFLGSGSKGLAAGSDFANLEDLRNHVHPFDPLPFFKPTPRFSQSLAYPPQADKPGRQEGHNVVRGKNPVT